MAGNYINKTISKIYRDNQRFFAQKIEEYSLPIDVGQIPTIMQVYRNPGITQEGISLNAGMDKGTVARTLKQLDEAGLIIRQTDKTDRRVNHIFATSEGLKIKGKLLDIIGQLHEILYQGFNDTEIYEAISLLERMQCNIDEYMARQK